jgi:enoyl-CoA hydratase
MRSDRRSALDQWNLSWEEATANEYRLGRATLEAGEAAAGAVRFAGGQGRGGSFK